MAERNIKMIDYDLMSVISHGITVSNLAYEVGEAMALPKDQCYELALAGILHDIGKLRLSRYVSGTEDPLVVEEIKYVRRHPQLGCEALQNIPVLCWRVFIIIMRTMTAAAIPRIFGEKKFLWEAGS